MNPKEILEYFETTIGKPKDVEDLKIRLEAANQFLDGSAERSRLTIEEPDIETRRENRNLDLETSDRKNQQMLGVQDQQTQMLTGATRELQGIQNEAQAAQTSAAADAAVKATAPGYAALESSGARSSEDYGKYMDNEYGDRAAFRELQKQQLDQRKGDRIFDMIKTLGLGGAILLS